MSIPTPRPAKALPGIKLRSLGITNFKAIDHLRLEFPPPVLAEDPDIFVLGSRNGVGKTSVLEAIGLLVMLAEWWGLEPANASRGGIVIEDSGVTEISDALIREPKRPANIAAELESSQGKAYGVSVSITSGKSIAIQVSQSPTANISLGATDNRRFRTSLRMLLGHYPETLLLPPLLHFHSFRKIQEGGLPMSQLLSSAPEDGRATLLTSFKFLVIRSLMQKSGLLEDVDNVQWHSDFGSSFLEEIMQEFSGGSIRQLRPVSGNAFELRIQPLSGEASYSFDGLSSGQKEIISLLFLVWHYSQAQGNVVLIDEPELHLNAEWHVGLLRRLHETAPQNQYIVATHSADVFGAVDPERRILLKPDSAG